jgi:hypothetical protein
MSISPPYLTDRALHSPANVAKPRKEQHAMMDCCLKRVPNQPTNGRKKTALMKIIENLGGEGEHRAIGKDIANDLPGRDKKSVLSVEDGCFLREVVAENLRGRGDWDQL